MMSKAKQSSPCPSVKSNYRAKVQCAKEADHFRKLNKEVKTFVQQVTGAFLFCGRAIYSTMLSNSPEYYSLNSQAEPTEETLEKVKQFLNFSGLCSIKSRCNIDLFSK